MPVQVCTQPVGQNKLRCIFFFSPCVCASWSGFLDQLGLALGPEEQNLALLLWVTYSFS